MSLPRFVKYLLAFTVPPLAVGALTLAVRMGRIGAPLEAAPAGALALPGPRPPIGRRPLAVIVAGNHGTEITDSLPIVELLAASGAFEVRVVAPERRLSPFATNSTADAGLDFVPDMSFAEYDGMVGRAPELLVVPYLQRWEREDAATLPWIVAHAGPATTVLSICRGAELVAATGLFDGHAATANDRSLDTLAERHPRVRWQRGVRWVRDGRRMSSALLASGLDATLAAIDALAGRAAAERAVTVTGYPGGLRALRDRSRTAPGISLGAVLEVAYRWETDRVAVVLADGVAESAVAGLLDAYGAALTTETIAVADARRIVRSRDGFALVPRATLGEVRDDDSVVSANAITFGYDHALLEVARTHGGPVAKNAGKRLDYDAAHLDLPGGLPIGLGVAPRPLLIGLAALALAWLSASRSRERTVAKVEVGAERPIVVPAARSAS